MDTNEGKMWDDPIDQELYSNNLGEDRIVSIYLPTSYYDDGKEYPVLFHLDGDVIQLDNDASDPLTCYVDGLQKLTGYVGVQRGFQAFKVNDKIITDCER